MFSITRGEVRSDLFSVEGMPSKVEDSFKRNDVEKPLAQFTHLDLSETGGPKGCNAFFHPLYIGRFLNKELHTVTTRSDISILPASDEGSSSPKRVFEKTFPCPHCKEEIEKVQVDSDIDCFWLRKPDEAYQMTAECLISNTIPHMYLTLMVMRKDKVLIEDYLKSHTLRMNSKVTMIDFASQNNFLEIIPLLLEGEEVSSEAYGAAVLFTYMDKHHGLFEELCSKVVFLDPDSSFNPFYRGELLFEVAKAMAKIKEALKQAPESERREKVNKSLKFMTFLVLKNFASREEAERFISLHCLGKALIELAKIGEADAISLLMPSCPEPLISIEHCDQIALEAVKYNGQDADVMETEGWGIYKELHVSYGILKALLGGKCKHNLSQKAREEAFIWNALHNAHGIKTAEYLHNQGSLSLECYDAVIDKTPFSNLNLLVEQWKFNEKYFNQPLAKVTSFFLAPFSNSKIVQSSSNQQSSPGTSTSLQTSSSSSSASASSSSTSQSVPSITLPPKDLTLDSNDEALTTTSMIFQKSAPSAMPVQQMEGSQVQEKEPLTSKGQVDEHQPSNLDKEESSIPFLAQPKKYTGDSTRISESSPFSSDKVALDEGWDEWWVMKVALLAIGLIASSVGGYAYLTYEIVDPVVIGSLTTAAISLVSSLVIHFFGEEDDPLEELA